MKYSVAAIIAAAAGASAHYAGNVTVITEVVDSYTTYCPGPTEITHGSQTYTVTEATTLTITDCPCTITKPVHVSTSYVCHTCAVPPPAGSSAVVVPPPAGPPAGETTPAVIPPPATGGVTPTKGPAPVPTAGAGKAAALSGAGLAGVVGLAAFIL